MCSEASALQQKVMLREQHGRRAGCPQVTTTRLQSLGTRLLGALRKNKVRLGAGRTSPSQRGGWIAQLASQTVFSGSGENPGRRAASSAEARSSLRLCHLPIQSEV